VGCIYRHTPSCWSGGTNLPSLANYNQCSLYLFLG
jgi:hypothetical protein